MLSFVDDHFLNSEMNSIDAKMIRSIFLVLWLVNPIPYTLNNTLNSKFPHMENGQNIIYDQMIEFIGKRSFGSFQMNTQMKLQKNEG